MKTFTKTLGDIVEALMIGVIAFILLSFIFSIHSALVGAGVTAFLSLVRLSQDHA